MQRGFNINYYSDPERGYYSASLTEDGLILANSSGTDENTVLHMFISLCTTALLNTKNKASLNDRLALLERFSTEIVFKREY